MTIIRNRKQWLKYRSKEWQSYIANSILPLPSNQTRLLIFGQGRTGSTLLESLLSSTGHFQPNGEILNTSKGEAKFPLSYVSGLCKLQSKQNFTFHTKIYQLTRDRKAPVDPKSFLETLSKQGWNIVYLRRRNKVKHALSNIISQHRGKFHKLNDKSEKMTIVLDRARLIELVNLRFKFEAEEEAAISGIKHHEVTYEDDLEKADCHQKTINQILDYVELEGRAVSTRHRKINTQPLHDLISNYDEFMNCLVQHGWDSHIEE